MTVRRKFIQAYDGEWLRPSMRNYLATCCECGVVHRKAFRVVADKRGRLCVEYSATRVGKLTKAQLRQCRETGSVKI